MLLQPYPVHLHEMSHQTGGGAEGGNGITIAVVTRGTGVAHKQASALELNSMYINEKICPQINTVTCTNFTCFQVSYARSALSSRVRRSIAKMHLVPLPPKEHPAFLKFFHLLAATGNSIRKLSVCLHMKLPPFPYLITNTVCLLFSADVTLN